MKLQRAIILMLVLSLTVGAEAMLMSHLTGRSTAELTPPAATPVPSAVAETTPTPGVSTPAATLPGFTSPPASRTSTTRTTTTNNTTNTTSNNDYDDSDNDYSYDDDDDDYYYQEEVPATAPPTEPPSSGVGSILASDGFSSDTGVGLNLNVSWQAVDLGGGRARISVSGSVSSYALAVMSLPVTISFGGYSTTVTGNSIDISSGAGLTTSSLFSTSFDVDAGSAGDMTVTWSYGGVYSQVELPEIVASGYVYTG